MNSDEMGSLSRRQALIVAAGALALIPILGRAASAAVRSDGLSGLPRRGEIFDFGWKFYRGSGESFEAVDLDDKDWRDLDLPHDWSIENLSPAEGRIGPFDPKQGGGSATAHTIGGEGWYRKHFRIDDLPADGHAAIRFDGVYMESDVWLNGQHLGRHAHGYTPFGYELTPHLRRNADNVLAVRVRNLGSNSRWYSGSGIYRAVTLDVLPTRARIEPWGVSAFTHRITDDAAEIVVATRLQDIDNGMMLATRIVDDRGKPVAETVVTAQPAVQQTIRLPSPRLWSPDTPAMYRIVTELRSGARALDRVHTPLGVRIVTIDTQQGVRINGQAIKLRGGCVHHDNGPLGAAAFADAEERKVRLLKARGFNAIRSSHNPTSREFRDACDRHGVLLIEECFDMWHKGKTPDDYSNQFATHWEEDLAAMILSARNNPSVILWSVGNEVPDRSTPEGVEWGWTLANKARETDPTRPVTAAINNFAGRLLVADAATARPGQAGVADEAAAMFLDVVGCNYKLDRYETDHANFPNRIMYGSESYAKDVFAIWSLTDRCPYLIGDFVWTAMDYLGEAGIGNSTRTKSRSALPGFGKPWPWVGANCGDLDLTGAPKAQSLARDVAWGLSPIEMVVQPPLPEVIYEHISNWGWWDELQSWTWPGSEHKPLNVRIYSLADRIEIRVNGSVVATRDVAPADRGRIEFSVAYTAGKLEAVAYRSGREIGRRALETTGPAAVLRLTPEPTRGRAARNSLSYIRVDVLDQRGRRVMDDARMVRLTLSGPASLAGVGSGNPLATGGFQSTEVEAYQGSALAIVKSDGRLGTVVVRADADGLKGGFVRLRMA